MQTMPSEKPATYRQQIEKLRGLGVVIADEPYAGEWLRNHTLHGFKRYLQHFMIGERLFIPNLPFEYVAYIYDFDRELRVLLLSHTEVIEDSLRSLLAYVFTHFHGSYGHCDPKNFLSTARHAVFLARLRREGAAGAPLEVAVGNMPLSALSMFYANAGLSAQREIARLLGVGKTDLLKNWLHALGVLRNRCARRERLYNIPIVPRIRLGRKLLGQNMKGESLLAAFYAVQRLMPTDAARVRFIGSLVRLIHKYAKVMDLSRLGLTAHYKTTLESFIFGGGGGAKKPWMDS